MEVWFEGVRMGEEDKEVGGGGGQAPWLLVGVCDHHHGDFATAIMSSIPSIVAALTPAQTSSHPLCSSFQEVGLPLIFSPCNSVWGRG